jgi:prevent-host-death family protein
MPEVGIRELKSHASAIIRQLRDQRTRYVITYHGRPVGLLLPLAETEPVPQTADPWDELIALGQRIGQGWNAGQTGADLLSEMRR